MSLDFCAVVNQHCAAPPYVVPPIRTRAMCVGCGLSVCTAPGCSTRATYFNYGQCRICATCLEQQFGDDPTIEIALRKIYWEQIEEAGFTGEAAEQIIAEWITRLARS